MLKEQMLINGQWVDAASQAVIEVRNPVDNEVFATVPKCDISEVDAAVAAARAAFPAWSKTTAFQRGRILREASRLVLENQAMIAGLMTREQGKPLAEATGEVQKGAQILRYYAEEGERVIGHIIPNEDGNDIESHVVYQPVGVAGCISPWNYPIELLAWKVGGALAAGCTVVLKVPSETPLSAIAFVRTMLLAQVPAGVINVITGPGATVGNRLAEHPDVRKIAFTGSTAVGRQIMATASQSLKRLSLELGGSLPMIVCDDARLDTAVAGAVRRSFRNMGQICIAVNRIYVARPIYEAFLEKFTTQTQKLVIGNGLTDKCDLGPMCTGKGVQTAHDHIADALAKGASLCCGGKAPAGERFSKGNFFEPTILRDVDHTMKVMQDETFGPVVGVMPFDTVDEAITLANDTIYGLAAIVFTESLSLARKLSLAIEAGNVAINNVDAGVINAPYGGWKASGFGHEHGSEGLYEYLNIKHIRVKDTLKRNCGLNQCREPAGTNAASPLERRMNHAGTPTGIPAGVPASTCPGTNRIKLCLPKIQHQLCPAAKQNAMIRA